MAQIETKKDLEYWPENDWILTKLSHVNQTMMEFETEVVDNREHEECHFLRILRVGPSVKDKESVAPGKLAVIRKSSGHYLPILSHKFKEDYYLIQESDILAFLDL